MKFYQKILLIAATFLFSDAYANIVIPMQLTADQANIGTVTAEQTKYGVLFTPDLHGLPPGMHGFHIHQNPACGDNGQGAGSHLDPANTGKHLGPYNDQGHLGDLPVLIVNDKGDATTPVLAPRLKLSEIKEHSLMIHQGGDNYSDTPVALGGGGPRIACGVIK